MTEKWNQIPPTRETPNKFVKVPLDAAIKDPRTVINPTVRTPLPPPANQLPATNEIKIRK